MLIERIIEILSLIVLNNKEGQILLKNEKTYLPYKVTNYRYAGKDLIVYIEKEEKHFLASEGE